MGSVLDDICVGLCVHVCMCHTEWIVPETTADRELIKSHDCLIESKVIL